MSKTYDLASAYNLPPDLFHRQIMAESGGNPRAVSPAGAMGSGQLMPATAKMYGVTDPFNEDQNLRGAAHYMSDLVKQYDGNYRAALAHYNGGTRSGKAVMAGQEPPFLETQNYVNKILGANMNNDRDYPQQPYPYSPPNIGVTKSMLPNAREYAEMNATKVERLPLAMAAILSGDRQIQKLGAALFADGNQAQSPDKLSAYMSLNPDGSILQVGNPDTLPIAQMRADAANYAKTNKQIPFSENKKLSAEAGNVDIMGGLASTFKDNFAGTTPIGVLGDVENWAASRFSSLGMQEQGNWWKNYNEQANRIRNELFGSALTAGEAAAFEKANIDPGMSPSEIRIRLTQQQAAAAAAYNKSLETAQGSGYNIGTHQPRTPMITPMSEKGPGAIPKTPAAPAAYPASPGAAPINPDDILKMYQQPVRK